MHIIGIVLLLYQPAIDKYDNYDLIIDANAANANPTN